MRFMFKSKLASSQSGFTLIEISMWLVIAGLLIVPAITVYRAFIEEQKISVNTGLMQDNGDSIGSYVTANSRYPAPASLLLGPDDAGYGEEVAGPYQPCPSWPTTSGVCRTTGPDPVLIGAFPFETIGIDEEFSIDYWGNKFLYVVTAAQVAGYTAGAGVVEANTTLYDPATATTSPITYTVDMLLISHGENARGAYSREGTLIAACSAADGRDWQNCNFDNNFLLHFNLDSPGTLDDPGALGYATGERNMVAGSNYYDDLSFRQRGGTISADDWGKNLVNNDYLVANVSKVGIGIEDMDHKVHVVGNVRADDIMAEEICDDAGNCFNPLLVAGNEPSMDCNNSNVPGEEAVLRIGMERVFCASALTKNIVTSTYSLSEGASRGVAYQFPASVITDQTECAPGELVTEIINGVKQCATP